MNKHLFKINESNNRVTTRESKKIEFKQNFSMVALPKYAKTIASFANNKGGFIIFGVTDTPRIAKGINDDSPFFKLDENKFSNDIELNMSPRIDMNIYSIDIKDNIFGIIEVKESNEKPIMFIKNCDKVYQEGDIFYRYFGQNGKIKSVDLQNIIRDREKKIEEKWLSQLKNMSNIGIDKVHIINKEDDLEKDGNGNIIISSDALKNMPYIKEGEFNETRGKEVIKVTANAKEKRLLSNIGLKDCFTAKQIAEFLGIMQKKNPKKASANYVSAIIKDFNIDNSEEYTQKDSKGHKYYTPKTLEFLKSKGITQEQAELTYKKIRFK